MQLTPAHLCLDNSPRDKIAAIARAAAMLVENGCVEEPFRYGMIAREAMGNTYLGHGVALPHGVEQTNRYIRENGIVFIRTVPPIPWGPQAEKVDTIIAIAAADDSYLQLLRHVTLLTEDPAILARLKESNDPAEIISLLSREDVDSAPGGDAEPALAYRQGLVYPHGPGLHLQPASSLSKLAKTLNANVHITNADGKTARAENIAQLLTLGITLGQVITVSADSKAAIDAIIAHIGEESITPEEDLLPLEVRRKPSKLPWIIGGGVVLAALALYALLG